MKILFWLGTGVAVGQQSPNIIRLPDIAGIINSIANNLPQANPRRTITQTLFGFAANPEPLGSDANAKLLEYKVNERGQFLDVRSYAEAMSDQLGIPMALASRLAELNQNLGKQLLQINSAVAEWANQDVPADSERNGSRAFPANGESKTNAQGADEESDDLVYPLVGSMIQNMVNRLTAGMRTPVRHELKSMDILVQTLSPVVLTR